MSTDTDDLQGLRARLDGPFWKGFISSLFDASMIRENADKLKGLRARLDDESFSGREPFWKHYTYVFDLLCRGTASLRRALLREANAKCVAELPQMLHEV